MKEVSTFIMSNIKEERISCELLKGIPTAAMFFLACFCKSRKCDFLAFPDPLLEVNQWYSKRHILETQRQMQNQWYSKRHILETQRQMQNQEKTPEQLDYCASKTHITKIHGNEYLFIKLFDKLTAGTMPTTRLMRFCNADYHNKTQMIW